MRSAHLNLVVRWNWMTWGGVCGQNKGDFRLVGSVAAGVMVGREFGVLMLGAAPGADGVETLGNDGSFHKEKAGCLRRVCCWRWR